mgnify:CR=1 FL=1
MIKQLFKLLWSFIRKPEFRQLATSIDYVQLVSYNEKDDLMIMLGHNPTQEPQQGEKPKLSLQFLLAVRGMAPEGIIESFEGGTSLTYFIEKETKEKVKEVLK